MTNKTDTTTTSRRDADPGVAAGRRGSPSSRPKKTKILLLLLLLASHLVAGQDDTVAGLVDTAATTTTPPPPAITACSCSPRVYVFRLDLSATCPALPPPFPPNDVFGSGVRDYTCNVGSEPIPKSQFSTEEDVGGGGGRRRRRGRGLRALRGEEDEDVDATENVSDYFPELSADELGLEWSSQEFATSQIDGDIDEASMIATMDTIPVVVYSIQFLEVDVDFNVVNQDSTYVRDIDFADGAMFNYTSIIAAAAPPGGNAVIPGGVNLVLRGVNAGGDPVRNVFTITFTNDCGVPTFEVGDAIGWVVFEDFVPASEETCRTTGTAPTTTSPIAPPTAPTPTPPTPTPPTPPAVLPSKGPSSSSSSMTYVAGWWEPHYGAFSKSGKEGSATKSGKKSGKSGKSGKADKSGKKNSTDGGGGDANHHGHGWHGDGYGRRLIWE